MFKWSFSPSSEDELVKALCSQLCLSSCSSHTFVLAQSWPGAHPEPQGEEIQPWQPNGSPSASLVIPLQDGLGTSFSAVIPAGDLHLVSTAWGHISRTQTLSQVPGTLKWFMLSVLCATIWMAVAQYMLYIPGIQDTPACSIAALLTSVQSYLPFQPW